MALHTGSSKNYIFLVTRGKLLEINWKQMSHPLGRSDLLLFDHHYSEMRKTLIVIKQSLEVN